MRLILFAISLLLPALVYADNVIVTSTNVIQVTPTITAGAYLSGDIIGGEISLPNAVRSHVDTGVISSIEIFDKSGLAIDINAVFFVGDPATTYTDNDDFQPSDADGVSFLRCPVSITDCIAATDNAFCSASNINCPFKLTESTDLRMVLIAGAGVTYVSTSDLTVKVGILQD